MTMTPKQWVALAAAPPRNKTRLVLGAIHIPEECMEASDGLRAHLFYSREGQPVGLWHAKNGEPVEGTLPNTVRMIPRAPDVRRFHLSAEQVDHLRALAAAATAAMRVSKSNPLYYLCFVVPPPATSKIYLNAEFVADVLTLGQLRQAAYSWTIAFRPVPGTPVLFTAKDDPKSWEPQAQALVMPILKDSQTRVDEDRFFSFTLTGEGEAQ